MKTTLLETKRYRWPHLGPDGAQVKFIRTNGRDRFTIYASVCYESWEQWGAPREVLIENVPTVERWRQGTL